MVSTKPPAMRTVHRFSSLLLITNHLLPITISSSPHFHQSIPSIPMRTQMLHRAPNLFFRDLLIGTFQHQPRLTPRQLENVAIAQQVRHPEVRHSSLFGSEELSRPPLLQV